MTDAEFLRMLIARYRMSRVNHARLERIAAKIEALPAFFALEQRVKSVVKEGKVS